MYKFIDLFCGIGGFRIALEGKGMECVFSSDIDKDVQATYVKNFGERPYGDLNEISEKKYQNTIFYVQVFLVNPLVFLVSNWD